MWANVRTFAVVLEPETIQRTTTGAVVLVAAAALFIILGLGRRYAGANRAGLAVAILLVASGSVGASMAFRGRGTHQPLNAHPLTIREAPPSQRPGRLVVIAIDGGSLDLIANAAAEGRLPNFGRILDLGASMHLATLHPTSAEAVWAAIATGKLPQKNGVRSSGVFPLGEGEPIQLLPQFCFANGLVRFGFLTEEPHTSATLRTRTLWSILSTLGIAVGVVKRYRERYD